MPAQAPNTAAAAAAPAPATQNLTARLYPSNAEASRCGTVTGLVTNDLNGHGSFSAVIGGESFQGEATRAPGSTRSGHCVLNNGPAFSMHVGG